MPETFVRTGASLWRWLATASAAGARRFKRGYVYRPRRRAHSFEEAATLLEARHVVVREWVDNGPDTMERVVHGLKERGLRVTPLPIDAEDFREYRERAGYDERYPTYARGFRLEKALEHYLAFRLLGPLDGATFLDVASEGSPIVDIFTRLAGCRGFRQDIMYWGGWGGWGGRHGDRIGGDACQMPVPAAFADKAALTCSFEHFEGDSDTRLFRELARVLKPGGQACVVPFYTFTEPANQTDPTLSVDNDVEFDPGAALYCAKGWGNRFGRFYSPDSFVERVVQPLRELFDFEVHHLVGAQELGPGVYARLVLRATRRDTQ